MKFIPMDVNIAITIIGKQLRLSKVLFVFGALLLLPDIKPANILARYFGNILPDHCK